jgi:hypothetical protein
MPLNGKVGVNEHGPRSHGRGLIHHNAGCKVLGGRQPPRVFTTEAALHCID